MNRILVSCACACASRKLEASAAIAHVNMRGFVRRHPVVMIFILTRPGDDVG
jgi:hypothetical protein